MPGKLWLRLGLTGRCSQWGHGPALDFPAGSLLNSKRDQSASGDNVSCYLEGVAEERAVLIRPWKESQMTLTEYLQSLCYV